MTGRMSAIAAILHLPLPTLIAKLMANNLLPRKFVREFNNPDTMKAAEEGFKLATDGGPVPRREPTFAEQPGGIERGPGSLHEFLSEAIPEAMAPAGKMYTDSIPTTDMSEADAAFTMVAKVIAQYPHAQISLEGLPAGVETRLRAAYPDTRFIQIDEATRAHVNKLIAEHEAKGDGKKLH